MSTLSIVSFTVLNYHRPGTTARLKVWFAQDFVTAEHQLVLGGAVRSGSIFLDVACTVNPTTHVLTIPTFSLPTTDDSSVRNVRATGVLFDSSGALVRNLFTNWIIPSELEPVSTFPSVNAFNAAPSQPPFATGITREQAIVLIAEGLQAEPVNGAFTTNRTPRASGPKTLVDGQVVDDGTDWTLQTLGDIEMGDHQTLGNGSRFAISDTLGRTSLFAGGGSEESPANEYAGMAAVCTEADAEVHLQTTGYSNVYANKSITRIGDGVNEHNGTYLEIDDLDQRIRVFNLPSSDPHVVNQAWRDSNGFLKISAG